MRTSLLLLPAILGLLVAGCVERVPEGGTSGPPGGQMLNNPTPQPSPSGQVELSLFTWTEVDELNVNQELIKEFEKQNPGITVKITNISGSKDAMQKLTTMFAAKTGPDVMSLHGAYYVGFADAGALMDLQPKIDADPDFHLEDFHPRLVELCKYQGKLYSLPRYTSVYALFYNKSLFDAEGLKYPGTGPSWTWSDYLEAAKKLTKDRDGDGKPDQWGCIIDFWGARLYPWLWSNGADLMDKDRQKCTMDSPEAIETLQFLADLRLKYKVAPATTSTERNQALDAFARGNIGMYMSGPWDIQTLNRVAGLKWDVAPLPTKKTRATMLGTENYAIYSGTKHPEEAWKLFKFLLSPQAQAVMADKLDKMPSRLSVLHGAYAKGKASYNRQVYVDAIEYGRQPPNIPEYSQIEGILQAELDRIWIGESTVPDGLRAVTQRVNKKLQEIRSQKSK
jgi:multiple sugar transport system substrate-binding protein